MHKAKGPGELQTTEHDANYLNGYCTGVGKYCPTLRHQRPLASSRPLNFELGTYSPIPMRPV